MPAIRILGALTFSLELGLPACLFRQKVRVRSLGRLDRYWLIQIILSHLEGRLEATNNWLCRSAGIGLDHKLRRSTQQEVLDFNKHLFDALQASSVNGSFNLSLLDKVFERILSNFIAMFLHVVIIEATVLLRLDVPGSERDALRVDSVWAIHARDDLALIKRQPLPLELGQGVFSDICHA